MEDFTISLLIIGLFLFLILMLLWVFGPNKKTKEEKQPVKFWKNGREKI